MIPVLRTVARLLTFRATSDELRSLNGRHLVFGLCLTWLVGMGRWWEDPKANLLQHLGLGSLAYIFVLAVFLWLLLWPLTPPYWSLQNVLIFVSLTSPPAILYALPVRHGFELPTAQTIRFWMLAVVAGWRVALLVFYLNRGAGLTGGRLFLASVFPLMLIVFTLTVLNLDRVVFNLMGGAGPEERTVNDSAYGILFLLTLLSGLAFVPMSAGYVYLSITSVIAKYGGRGRIILLGVAFVFVGAGLELLFYGFALLGTVAIALGVMILAATLANKP